MFAKLFRYELKSVGKWYLSLYGLSLLAAFLLGSWINFLINNSNYTDNAIFPVIISMLIFLGFGALMAGLALSTLYLVIKRFRNNIFGQQGYLTMTLPATTHHILLSKLASALLWNLLAAVTVVLSLLIIGFLTQGSLDFFKIDLPALQEFLPFLKQPSYFIDIVLGAITSILIIYLAIAIGHLAENHRIVLSFVAYFIIQAIISTIEVLFLNSNFTMLDHFTTFYVYDCIYRAILGLIAYFTTHYLIKNKLNIH